MSGASAAQRAIRAARAGEASVISLQELHGRIRAPDLAVEGDESTAGAERSA